MNKNTASSAGLGVLYTSQGSRGQGTPSQRNGLALGITGFPLGSRLAACGVMDNHGTYHQRAVAVWFNSTAGTN